MSTLRNGYTMNTRALNLVSASIKVILALRIVYQYYFVQCKILRSVIIIMQNTEVMGKMLALIMALILSPILFELSVEGTTKPVDKAIPASEAEGRNQRTRTRYTASWAVKIDGGEKMADTIAKRNGFRNRGKVRERGDVRE